MMDVDMKLLMKCRVSDVSWVHVGRRFMFYVREQENSDAS